MPGFRALTITSAAAAMLVLTVAVTVPAAAAFVDAHTALVSERPGRLRIINNGVLQKPVVGKQAAGHGLGPRDLRLLTLDGDRFQHEEILFRAEGVLTSRWLGRTEPFTWSLTAPAKFCG
jgi:hypothetical protein